MKSKKFLSLCFLIFILAFTGISQQIIYVDSSATGLNNGSSWVNAYKNLDSAFNKNSQLNGNDTIRVAKGTYRPSQLPRGVAATGDNRDFAFHFPDSCVVWGGYPSGGGLRDAKRNLTILSGDINVLGSQDDNAFHVVVFQNAKSVADGFTVTDGLAFGDGSLLLNGKALFRDGGGGAIIDHSNVTLSNIVVAKNFSLRTGGGITSKQSTLTTNNSFFSENFAFEAGGGICNDTSSTMVLANCVFVDNFSQQGGAIYNEQSTSTIRHTTFARNQGAIFGGAIYNGYIQSCNISNSVFSLNTTGSDEQGESPNDDIFEETNGAFKTIVTYSSLQAFIGQAGCVYAGDAGLANHADPDGPDNLFGTADDGLMITAQSPGFNTGSGGIENRDIVGVTRNINSKFDMGAYEIDPCSRLSSRTVYIDSAQARNHSGNSWNDALSSIQAGINLAIAGCVDTIKIAKGTYFPSTVPRGWVPGQTNIIPAGFKAFHLPANIVVIGGYAPGGATRDPLLFPSVITRNPEIYSKGQLLMVLAVSNVVLDGLIIRDADTDGSPITIASKSYRRDAGAGIFISGASISIRNCSFSKNYASALGGGIYAENSVVKIDSCRFNNNRAYYAVESSGGGIHLDQAGAGSYIKYSSFTSNAGRYYGGGISLFKCTNDVLVDSCRFTRNIVEVAAGNTVGGGAIVSREGSRMHLMHSIFEENKGHLGGAVNLRDNTVTFINECFFIKDSATREGGAVIVDNAGKLEIGNSVFIGNMAQSGGAVRVQGDTKIQGSTFFENMASVSGGAVSAPYATLTEVIGSVFWRNTQNGNAVTAGSDIAMLAGAGLVGYNAFQTYTNEYSNHNITGVNPMFRDTANLKGTDGNWGTADDGLQLKVRSPLINEVPYGSFFGPDPAFYFSDIKNDPRIQNKSGDMGAYEADFCGMSTFTNKTVYVDSSVIGGNGTGNSWANAFTNIEDALKAARGACIDTIKVAKGTYQPEAAAGYNRYNSAAIQYNRVFAMRDSLHLLGGYPSGGGTRSHADNPVILNGYSFIQLFYLDGMNKAVVDGFTLDSRAFTANSSAFTFRNSVFRNITGNPSPVRLTGSNANMINCVFENNKGSDFSAAIWQENSNVNYTNCVFNKNINAGIGASCVYLTGASDAVINNSTFFGNRCGFGGAVSNNGTTKKIIANNSVFWSNKSLSAGNFDPFANDIWPQSSPPANLVVSHCLFQYQPTTIAPDPNSIYAVYPEFSDSSNVRGADQVWGTDDDGLILKSFSVAVNSGSNALIPAGIDKDLAGINRICGDTVDRGAYEFDCLGGRFSNKLVTLGAKEVSSAIVPGCGALNYMKSPTTPDQYIALINGNGNNINITSVTVDATTNLIHYRTNGTDTTAVANRMISVIAPGTYANNGGAKVRIYYNPGEFAGLPALSRSWFKHPAHTKAGVLADLQVNGLDNATLLTPVSSGIENGILYVEFEKITGFSTFGLVATNIGQGADLVISNHHVNTGNAATGTEISVDFTESNTGNLATTAHKVHFYLSNDINLTPGQNADTLLGSKDISALAAHSNTGTLSVILKIPCSLTPGNYYLFIVADGANTVVEYNENNNSVSLPLTISAGMVVNLSADYTVRCQGDSVKLTATGATTYAWSGPGLNTTAGASVSAVLADTGDIIYSVVGTSNGCTSSPKTITIKSNALPDVHIAEPDTSICNNASVNLHATGAVSYNWSPATGLNISNGPTVIATPAVTTDYMVKGIAANGCSKNDSIRIAVLPAIVPSVSIANTGCPSNTLNFQATSSNGGTNPQYQWFVNDASAGTGATFTLNNATNNTKVRCRLTSNANCTVSQTAEDSIVVNCIITAVSDIDGLEEFHVSPNPTPDLLNIYIRLSQAKKVSYELFSSTGAKLYSLGPVRISGSSIQQIDLSKLLPGFYFLKVKIDKQELMSKVIKIN